MVEAGKRMSDEVLGLHKAVIVHSIKELDQALIILRFLRDSEAARLELIGEEEARARYFLNKVAITEDIAEINLVLAVLNGLKNVNLARLELIGAEEARICTELAGIRPEDPTATNDR